LIAYELIRLTKRLEDVQRGVLLHNGEPILSTLELPWKDNKPNISCIPQGRYYCTRTKDRTLAGGTHIPETFEVNDVKDRSGILFHVGNFAKETHGCILLGQGYDYSPGYPMITHSENAFKRFLNETKNTDSFALLIRRLHGVRIT
jgi:hypothetical protein